MDYAIRCNEIWAQAQIEAGADALWLGDCLATSKFISLDSFRELAAEPADICAEIIRRHGGYSFYHGCESNLNYLDAAATLVNSSALNVGESADLAEAQRRLGYRRCLMGNLDPIAGLMNAGPEESYAAAAETVRKGRSQGTGYIFCTAEGIPHCVGLENVLACHRAVKSDV